MRDFITKTTLMRHQQAAVSKRLPVRVGGLFMEMQTGKTRTSIELAKLRAHKIDKVVWFSPVSLKLTVAGQIREHTDCEDICVFDARTNQCNLPCKRWYIVGTESMSSSNRVVAAVNSLITNQTYVVMDESSYIKGHRAKRTERLTFICARSKYREILTGTPLSEGVIDLYSQMRFLSERILGYSSFYSFEANHLEYSERFPGMIVRAHNTEWLAAKIEPYVYQVRKKDCLDLPPQMYSTKYCAMTYQQRNAYEKLKDEFLTYNDPDDWDSYKLFQLFSALQQVVSGFYNEKKRSGQEIRHEYDNDRPDLLREIVARLSKGEQVIIWGKYIYDIEQICRVLENKAYVVYTGEQSEKKREKGKIAFRAGEAQFFVATPGTGSHGLTLMNASTEIFYTNSFKYSERDQAESRCHGIGQVKTVHYIDFVCENSIDERIMNSISKKESTLKSFQREIDRAQGKKNKLRELIRRL
jgi:SNF2 family DNA or RNA helicase